MEHTYEYRGQKITISTTRTDATPAGYVPHIVVGGVVQTLNPIGPYPPHQFPKEEAAIVYGKQAAGWLVDNLADAEEKE